MENKNRAAFVAAYKLAEKYEQITTEEELKKMVVEADEIYRGIMEDASAEMLYRQIFCALTNWLAWRIEI